MTFQLNPSSQGDEIRNLFTTYGGDDGLRRFAQRCIESALFDETQLEGFQIVGAMKCVKGALRSKGENGLRFAYNTSKQNGESAIWKAQGVLDYADAVFILQSNYIDHLADTHSEMVVFHEWVKARFGTAPSIPMLEM